MSGQTMIDEMSRFVQLPAGLKIPGDDLSAVPQQLADAIAQAGFQSTRGTIAFAGEYPSATYEVEFNNGPAVVHVYAARRF
jgi:hypothetical protein